MALDLSNMLRRERALADARRRLALLEIETHRIKAELARLEAENESEWAEELVERWGLPVDRSADADSNGEWSAAVNRSLIDIGDRAPEEKAVAPTPTPTLPKIHITAGKGTAAPKRRSKRLSSGWWVSLALHAAALAVLAPMTFVLITNESVPLFATMYDAEKLDLGPEVAPVEMVVEEERFVQEALFEDASLPLAEGLSNDVAPLAPATGDLAFTAGQFSGLPTDLGTLMSGGGPDTAASGRKRGRSNLPPVEFFGTQAVGNRFVFVVDNSRSMRDGRFEAAVAELTEAVDGLTERQMFYVIFVADVPYPMFYPQVQPALVPATKENKQRLAQWLPKAMLADGRNRELINAMQLAAALNPEVVFLLWDSDWKYHEPKRAEVMRQLARPDQWNFAVHTIGLGDNSRDAAHHLSAIANAHRGTYRAVSKSQLPARQQPAR